MEEKQILVSINEEKTKHISEVLGNKTCLKILDALSEKSLTESEISSKLKIPLNTIDYNIKKLEKSGLVEKSVDYFWSTRGKKMPVWKVSNKKIIISPKSSLSSLKTLVPAFVVTGVVAVGIKLIESSRTIFRGIEKDFSAGVLESNSVDSVAEIVTQTSSYGTNSFFDLSPWSLFLIGAWFALVIFLLLNLRNKNGKL